MFIHYVSNYIEYLEVERGLTQNTLDAYRRDILQFFEFIAEQNIGEFVGIKRPHINLYLKYMRDKNIAPTSLSRKIASLKGFFNWLNTVLDLNYNPTLSLEQPKLSKRLPHVLTTEDIEKILSSDLSLRDKAIIELMYAGGLRVSELCSLYPNNIDLNSKYVRCIGKAQRKELFLLEKRRLKHLGII